MVRFLNDWNKPRNIGRVTRAGMQPGGEVAW